MNIKACAVQKPVLMYFHLKISRQQCLELHWMEILHKWGGKKEDAKSEKNNSHGGYSQHTGMFSEFLDAFGSGIVAVRPHGYTGSFKSREYGETTCYKIYADYWVETEKGIFRLNFDCVIKNETAPEEVGIYRIFLVPKEDDESGKYSGAGGSEFYICVFPFED